MRKRQHLAARAAAIATMVCCALSMTAAAAASPGAVSPATTAEELAQKYAPIIAVQEHPGVCGDGEAYTPAPVESVLGQPSVQLRAADGTVLKAGPTADDLATAPPDAYLDLPGNALDPGCDYEQWFASTGMAAHPTVYSRVATDSEHPGRLALQYWVFWVYNDWNDRHEGDWEMLQLAFDADSPEAALSAAPVEVAVAQHEGSERRPWDRVQKDGDHPVVYPGTGSHATYYSPNHWFGKSAASGFGCDDTRGPSTRITPTVVPLPDEPSGTFAWVSFQGRWGERQRTFNNGPTGPITKDQWAHPISWMETEGRDGSVSLPPLGTRVTDFFCGASRAGSVLFIRFLDRPALVLGAVIAVILLIVIGVKRTLWSPDLPLPLIAPRRNGQILRGAARLVFEHRRQFRSVMTLVLCGGIAASAMQVLVLRLPVFDDVTDIVGRGNSIGATVGLLAGALVAVPVAVLAHAASVKLAGEIDASADTHRIVRRTWKAPVLRSSAAFLLLVSVLVAFPLFAAIAATLWCLSTSAADHDGTGVVASFRRSRHLGKHQRFRTLVMVVVVVGIAIFLGPLVGTMILILTNSSFGIVNLVASLFGAVLVPWMGVALRLLHGDRMAAQAALETVES